MSKNNTKVEGGMPDRIFDTFPCHFGVTAYLSVRGDLDNVDAELCLTFDDQMQLLSTCNGWNRRVSNGLIDPAYRGCGSSHGAYVLRHTGLQGKLVLSFGDCIKYRSIPKGRPSA
jgi:hypothetical protein